MSEAFGFEDSGLRFPSGLGGGMVVIREDCADAAECRAGCKDDSDCKTSGCKTGTCNSPQCQGGCKDPCKCSSEKS